MSETKPEKAERYGAEEVALLPNASAHKQYLDIVKSRKEGDYESRFKVLNKAAQLLDLPIKNFTWTSSDNPSTQERRLRDLSNRFIQAVEERRQDNKNGPAASPRQKKKPTDSPLNGGTGRTPPGGLLINPSHAQKPEYKRARELAIKLKETSDARLFADFLNLCPDSSRGCLRAAINQASRSKSTQVILGGLSSEEIERCINAQATLCSQGVKVMNDQERDVNASEQGAAEGGQDQKDPKLAEIEQERDRLRRQMEGQRKANEQLSQQLQQEREQRVRAEQERKKQEEKHRNEVEQLRQRMAAYEKQQADAGQQHNEERRLHEENRSKKRFWGIVAGLVVIAIIALAIFIVNATQGGKTTLSPAAETQIPEANWDELIKIGPQKE